MGDNVLAVNKNGFSDWLMEEMRAHGWTHAELARRAGVSRPTITNLLKGSRAIGVETASGLAKAFGYSVDYVLQQADMTPATSIEERLADIYLAKLGRLSEQGRQEALSYLDFLEQKERAREGEKRS